MEDDRGRGQMQLMEPVAAVLLTAEALGNPMHVGLLMVFTPPRDAGAGYVDRLYDDAFAADIGVDPQLLRRPHRSVATAGLWTWQDGGELELGRHFTRQTLATGTREELEELVGRLHAEPLPRDRPLWEAALIDGLADDRFAFYIKVHHAVMDGVNGLRLVEDAMSTDPAHRGMPPFFGRLPTAPAAGTAAPAAARSHLPVVGSAVHLATGAAGLARRIAEGELGYLVHGISGDSTVLPFRAPRTRLNGPISSERAFASGGWPRARLQRVQRAAGDVTVNDVLTTIIGGGLHAWLADQGEEPTGSLVAICPVSVRTVPEGGGAGNAFGTAICNLGTSYDDPRERLDVVHRSMAEAKGRVLGLGPVPSLLVAAPSILPTILLPMLPVDPRVRPGYNVPISSVPGPRSDLYWEGAHLDEMYPVSVVYDGMALNVTACSCAGQVFVGYLAGGQAVAGLGSLAAHTERALVELETALGVR